MYSQLGEFTILTLDRREFRNNVSRRIIETLLYTTQFQVVHKTAHNEAVESVVPASESATVAIMEFALQDSTRVKLQRFSESRTTAAQYVGALESKCHYVCLFAENKYRQARKQEEGSCFFNRLAR
jgi:hypothetical protein